MNVKAVSVTQWCFFTQQSIETPKLSRDIADGLRGADGWQPKAPTTASGRGNQPAGGDPESNRGCPGPRDIKRDGHNRLETSVKPALSRYRAGPRSSLNQGPVHAGVTVVAAPSGKRSKWCRLGTYIFLKHRWHHAAPGRTSTDILTEAFFQPPLPRRVERQCHGVRGAGCSTTNNVAF